MNIFYLDKDPQLAARYQCNKHVIKMIVESAQLLSTAHRVLDGIEYLENKRKRYKLYDGREYILYKATHINHPCTIWCRQSKENYFWLFDHFKFLMEEYTHRYGKFHKCKDMMSFLIVPPESLKNEDFTTPPACMPDEYKISSNIVTNYREYYRNGKKHLLQWKIREKPEWIENANNF